MDTIFRELDNGLKQGFFYLSLILALTLPDICSALEAPSGFTSDALFKAWCRKWFLKGVYKKHLTASDIYYLRCGVVHQGRLGHPKVPYERIIFSLPTGMRWHANILKAKDATGQEKQCLNLDVVIFCQDMKKATQAWFADRATDQTVQTHLANLVQYRPNGLLPWIDSNTVCIS